MRKVKMTKLTPGSPDGFTVVSYKVDEEYALPDHLAAVFVDTLKVAEYVVAGRRDPIPEAKMVNGAPENKMAPSESEQEPYVPAETPTKPPVRGAAARKG